MAHSLGALCHMEPINMPKKAEAWSTSLGPRNSLAWGPGVQGQGLDRRAVFEMGPKERLQGSGWKLHSVGEPVACQSVLKDSDSFFTESPTKSLIRPQSRVRREKNEGPMSRRATVAQDRAALRPGPCSIYLRAGGLQPGAPASRLSVMLLRLDLPGWKKRSHTYPIVTYL